MTQTTVPTGSFFFYRIMKIHGTSVAPLGEIAGVVWLLSNDSIFRIARDFALSSAPLNTLEIRDETKCVTTPPATQVDETKRGVILSANEI